MTDWPILSTVTFLPLVGALLVLMIRDDSDAARRNIRNVTLWTTIITFLLSLPIWYYFDNGQAGFQFVEKAAGSTPEFPIIWASTAFQCCSSSSPHS